MSYVPAPQEWDSNPPQSSPPLTITVHPPAITARPIGFAPWPKPPKKRKRKKGKR